jgi:hypothetical protein
VSVDVSLTALFELGLRINSSRDLDQARWLVRPVGGDAVRKTTHELGSRHMPRPQKVIEHLGPERRSTPRPDLPHAAAAQARKRQRGRFVERYAPHSRQAMAGAANVLG